MGLTHAENLAHRVRGARLAAVTTSRAERVAEARQCCGDVAAYPTVKALLAAERLDGVVIASSTSAHADNVEQCAAAGWHIFCKKPLVLTLADCDRAIAAAEQAGIKLMIGHVRQFDAGHVEARRLIEAGAIGQRVHHDMARTTPERLGEAFVAELQAFVDCIARDAEPPVTGHDSRATVAVGIAATRSMHRNRPVDIT
jgi:predicted dehydrogenase